MDHENSPVIEKLSLVESKLYVLNQEEQYLDFLVPDIQTQMIAEEELDESYPRSDEEEDHTRIFMNYTNLNGNSVFFKLNDAERLARVFDIDSFVTGYFSTVHEGVNTERVIELMRPSLVSVINQSVVTTLELGDEKLLPVTKKIAETVLQSLIAILLNDPLDAIVMIKEQAPKVGEIHADPIILGIWAVKTRD